jgi:Tfp pilus assembly protein PilN
MRFSVTSPARQPGSQLIDLNLVPREYRPKPFPILTAGLGLLVVGSLVLLYALLYAKTYSDLELTQLDRRLAQAQVVVQSATGDPAALAQKAQLTAMRDDYRVLAQRQINWGDVLQTVGDVPPSILLKAINQAGFGVSVTGSAADQTAAAAYLDKLRSSGLFVNASIQVQPSNAPGLFATPTPLPTPPPTQEPTQVSIQPAPLPVPPAQPAQPAEPPAAPIVAPSQPPPAPPARAPAPVAPAPAAIPQVASSTKVMSATRTPTPAATGTPSPTITPTPQFNYALLSQQQLPSANPYAASSGITGQVIDLSKNPVVGVTIEIDSEGSPAWSIQQATDTSGNFSFSVTHGKFKVFVVDPSTQAAVDLYTGADGQAGTYSYQLTFQKTFAGTPLVVGSITPTETPTVAVTATPIVPGQNVANLGCATAYMIQNGQVLPVPGTSSPFLAIDNNAGTEWNAGTSPANGTQIIWQWQAPEPVAPGRATCASGYGSGISDSADQIVAFQLVPDQNPAGTTDHELWLYSDTGCSQNLQTTNTPYYIWNQYTSAGQVLPLNFSQSLPIRCVIVRTVTDPSFVAWEDVQIYQALPPPQGFPTLTGTPGPSGTPTKTATAPTATSTITGTLPPTSTATPTPPSPTPLAPVPGKNIARYSGAISGQTGTPVTNCASTPTPAPTGSLCAAIDNSDVSYWSPTAGSTDPQGINLSLTSTQYNPLTDSIGDIRLVVQSKGTGAGILYQVVLNNQAQQCVFSTSSGYSDYTELDCPLPGSQSGIAYVSVLMSQNGTEDGSYGIREIQVFKNDVCTLGTCTPSPTPTGPIPTSTNTATATGTPTITPLPIVGGLNIAPLATVQPIRGAATVCAGTPLPPGKSSDPCATTDGNPGSYWVPPTGPSDPQGIDLKFAFQTPGPSVSDIRVQVQSTGLGGQEDYQVIVSGAPLNSATLECDWHSPSSGFADYTQLDCPITTPVVPTTISIAMYHGNGHEDGNYGIREIQAFSVVTNLTVRNIPSDQPPAVGPSNRPGLGSGPGAAPSTGPSQTTPVPGDLGGQPGPAGQSPVATIAAPVGGPVDFTIVLEVASGKGY